MFFPFLLPFPAGFFKKPETGTKTVPETGKKRSWKRSKKPIREQGFRRRVALFSTLFRPFFLRTKFPPYQLGCIYLLTYCICSEEMSVETPNKPRTMLEQGLNKARTRSGFQNSFFQCLEQGRNKVAANKATLLATMIFSVTYSKIFV